MSSFVVEDHTCIMFLDAGCADPDDCGAASYVTGYMTEPRNQFSKLVLVMVGGQNPKQNAHIVAKCLAASDRGDMALKLGDINLVIANPTNGGHDFEYGSDWEGPIDKMRNLETRITGKISMLIAGPPCGFDMNDFIDWEHSYLHACVFVGNKPGGSNLGVNGGGTLTSDKDKAEIQTYIAFLEEKLGASGLIYLPPNFTRAQPLTMKSLNLHKNPVLTELYVNVTTKYLLKDRPVHLPPGLQHRIACANLRSLTAMCECWPKDSVRPADALNDPAFVKLGLVYSKRTDFGKDRDKSMMDIPDVDDVDKGKMRAALAQVTGQIFTCQAFINTLGFTAEAAATPEEGLARYMSELAEGVDMPLMPFYDGIGIAVLCMMSRETNKGLMYKSFENAFSKVKCPEYMRYPMEVMQHLIHFELRKF